MRKTCVSRSRRSWGVVPGLLALATVLAAPATTWAGGKLAWLDEVVQQAVREAELSGKGLVKGADGASVHTAERLFVREADSTFETLARGSDDLARAGSRLDEPAEAALKNRFTRMLGADDPELLRTFSNLSPAERRLAVEMGETAQRLARRYPGQADPLIRRLGVEGLSAVRTYGDDVAEVIAKEGPESIGVLRKTGRGGWKFFTETVLPHKKKLAAAGVLALFLANPEKFVDEAGRVTQYAVDQFARAGIDLAGSLGDGAQRGLESAIGAKLDEYGLNSLVLRKAGMIVAALVAFLATMVLLGLPLAWMLRPFVWPLKVVRAVFRRGVAKTA